MTLTALALVLAAALAHTVWNILAARSSRSGIPFLFWGAVVSAVVWAAAIPLTGGFGQASAGSFAFVVAISGLLHVVYMLVLQRGYRSGDLSTVYATARGSGPVLTVLVSVVWLGERPGALALAGVLLVVAGVTTFGLVGRSRNHRAAGATRPPLRFRIDPSILFGLLTGVAIGAYTLWDVSMVNTLGIAPVAFMVGTSAAEAVFFGAMLGAEGVSGQQPMRRLRGELRGNWRGLVAFGVLSPLSYILVLTAATMAPLSLVAPMRETSVVLVGLYGVIRYRESNPALRLAAAAIVLCGVVLIGL